MSALIRAASILVASLYLVPTAQAERMLDEMLHDFPAKTLTIECENLAVLRALPNFASLQRQYLGQPLQDLQIAFANAGIQAENVDEISIGAQNAAAPPLQTYGLFSGRFSLAGANLIRTLIGETAVYCLAAEKGGLCFAQLDAALGAFGNLDGLRTLLETRQGATPAIGSKRIFASLLTATQSSAPLRGLSDGSQIGRYVQEIVPEQAKHLMDWQTLFASVNAFSYSIKVDTKAHLTLLLDCQSETAAATLRQLLSMVGSLQSAAGQGSQIQNMQVDSAGSRVKLTLDSAI